jgi:hypothetical protein
LGEREEIGKAETPAPANGEKLSMNLKMRVLIFKVKLRTFSPKFPAIRPKRGRGLSGMKLPARVVFARVWSFDFI